MIHIFFFFWRKIFAMLLFLVGKEKHGNGFHRPVLSSSVFEECLSHPLLLFSGQRATLKQQAIQYFIQHVRTHGSDSAAALRAKCVSVCAKTDFFCLSLDVLLQLFRLWLPYYPELKRSDLQAENKLHKQISIKPIPT